MKAVVLLALLLVPAALAKTEIVNPNESTPVTLYFHLAGLQDFPINTQLPDDRFGGAVRKGVATNSATCLPEGVSPAVRGDHHTFYGYSTPGYVEYEHTVNGGPGTHGERGISFDVRLDTTAPATLFWYLETQAAGLDGDPDPHQAPLAVPNVVVQATMRAGNEISIDDAAMNAGQVIARGRLGPVQLHPATTDVPHHEVAGRHVYEFAVPLDFEGATIPGADSFNVRIDTFVENPLCSDPSYPENAYLMPNLVAIHTSPGLRPRMAFAITNPLVVSTLHPQFIGDELVVHSGVNSPWGNYDVDESEAGVRLEIDGPSPALTVQRHVVNPEDRDGHYGHTKDLVVAWSWAYQQDAARPGVYTVRLTALNDQGTAVALADSTFAIGTDCDDEEACLPTRGPTGQGAPGPALPVLLAGLAVLAGAARRLRRAREAAP